MMTDDVNGKSFDRFVVILCPDDSMCICTPDMGELSVEQRSRLISAIEKKYARNFDNRACVYLMLNPENGLYKIGVSADPVRRCQELRATLVHTICGSSLLAYKAEVNLHAYYRLQKAHGEWFRLTRDDVETVLGCISCEDALALQRGIIPDDVERWLESE